jgi:hypothetical protein
MAWTKNILSISFFQGWVRAFKLDRSGNEKSWSASENVDSYEEIRDAFKEAVRATDSGGSYASIVLNHDLLRHKTIEIPPMNSKNTRLYLTRKVNQIKEFNEEAAFSYTKTSTRDKTHVSINYVPLSFVNDLKQACMDANVFLMQILPFIRVREQQFRGLSIDKDEAAMIIVKMYDKVSLLIGNSYGVVFSDRRLNVEAETDEDIERIVKEIKRSILYYKQQFGERVVLARLSEQFSKNVFEYFKKNLDIQVDWMPPKPRRFYWNSELLNISFNDKANMLLGRFRNEIMIRKYTRPAVVLVLVFLVGSISASAVIEYLLYQKRKLLADIKPQVIELRNSKRSLLERKEKLDRLRYTVNVMNDNRVPPVPGWFLGYLCSKVPDGLVLTKTQVSHRENTWEVLIEGITENRAVTEKLRLLCNTLQNGPYKMRVNNDWYKNWLKQLRDGAVNDSGMSRFSVSGVIQ